jgi:hypothetical protein
VATARYLGPERVSVPLLGRDVDPDEAVEVPDEYLEQYSWGPDWQVEGSSDDPRTVPDLKAELSKRGLPTSGNKAELIERLAQPEPAQQ